MRHPAKLFNILGIIQKCLKSHKYICFINRENLLTSFLGKIIENIITNRVYWCNNNIMNKQQNGFRSKRRTNENLLKSTQSLKQNISRNFTSVVFLYVEKAFDQVWHAGILHKIKNFGMDPNLLRWINCFLCERSISIKIQYTLFIIYVSDFPKVKMYKQQTCHNLLTKQLSGSMEKTPFST